MGACNSRNNNYHGHRHHHRTPLSKDGPVHHVSMTKKNGKKKKILINDLKEKDITLNQEQRVKDNQRLGGQDMIQLNRKPFSEVYTFVDMIKRDLVIETQLVKHKQLGLERIARIRQRKHNAQEMEEFTRFMQVMLQLDHPNIVIIHEYFIEKQSFIIIFEHLGAGDLASKFTNKKYDYTESDLAYVMRQVFEVLNYLHCNGIIHRDIKVDNFLCANQQFSSEVKIIGFISSVHHITAGKLQRTYGSTYYRSPEMLRENYDSKTDIWSCGVMLFFLLSGTMPFRGQTEERISKSILRGAYTFADDIWHSVSKPAKDFVQKLLTYSPTKRISAEQALAHEWLNQKELMPRYINKQALLQLNDFRVQIQFIKSSMKFQDAVLMYAINLLATREMKFKLMKTFKGLDLNGDGRLSKAELVKGYQIIMSDEDAEVSVNKILKRLDDNQNGYIDYSEFVMATIDRKLLLNNQNLRTVFKLIDKNNDGFLSVQELKSTFGNQNMEDDLWEYTIKLIDKNKDGKINLTEFVDLMRRFEAAE